MNKLDELAERKAKYDCQRMNYEAARNAVLEQVRDQLQAIEDTWQPRLTETEQEIAALTGEIRADVLAHGESVKGAHLMAVYSQGRTSWDTRKLDGYAAAHPEIEAFKKVGEPSVSIRAIG